MRSVQGITNGEYAGDRTAKFCPAADGKGNPDRLLKEKENMMTAGDVRHEIGWKESHCL